MNLKQPQWHLSRAAMLTIAVCLMLYLYANRHSLSTLNGSETINGIKAVTHTLSACDDFDPATVSSDLHRLIDGQVSINGSAIENFVCSITKHNMNYSAQLDCPLNISSRYERLRVQPSSFLATFKVKYFFALDLHQAVHILIPLMGAILETMRFLGPQYCALSIVEGRSTDGTYDILVALERELASMGVRYHLGTNNLNPKAEGEDRIKDLAILRNQAIAPLVTAGTGKYSPYAADALIIFVNDIVLCTEDLLELIYQHHHQDAQMTCAFDWNAGGGSFYDSWVSRSMSGNLFFEITHNTGLEMICSLMICSPPNAMGEGFPCKFTLAGGACSEPGECYMGEPMTLGKDLWKMGMGKILAVSSINIAYEYKSTREAKNAYKYVHQIIQSERYETESEVVQWQADPPPKVKCMPWFNNQSWMDPL